ncbi:MAG: molybdopterin adenylyltransferase [Bacteroidetes bacterium]|nr:molybdopterin adenylyltransferase [Bacteroidota bacterium]
MSFKIGIITASDRGSRGEYTYLSGEEVAKVMNEFFETPFTHIHKVIPDEQPEIERGFIELIDDEKCDLVISTGGTGPAPRDVTPEATAAICDKMLPGFGELMRQHSMSYVKTAILSRQSAGIRGKSLIINMPGKPRSIRQCMEAIAYAIPYAITLIGGPKVKMVGEYDYNPNK